MRLCWKKAQPTETERRIRANDSVYNAAFQYTNNHICTSKYTALTFLPKNLLEQFQRIANFYFLVLLVLQLIPQITALTWVTTLLPLLGVLALSAGKDLLDDILIPEISSLTPLTTIIPLIAVLAISAIKDAVDDLQRHRSDSQVNNRLSWVLREGKLVQEVWHKVVVGDIIKMENDQFVAADLLLLSTSEPSSLCYVETAELDGETNLKVRQALPETSEMYSKLEQLSKFDGEIVSEPPNNLLNKFVGVLKWKGVSYPLDNNKLLLRGCVLRNTLWCYGLVVFAGKDTKLMMNSGKTTFKRTHIDKLMNILFVGIFVFLLCICTLCSVCCAIWESHIGYRFQVFLPWERFIPGSVLRHGSDETFVTGSAVIASLVFLSYLIVLNTVVPISLYVSWWINWDSKMYDEQSDTPAKARTTTLNEELGQIEYIFSDKTGTLTQNVMTFDKCTINGKIYGDLLDERGNAVDITESSKRVDFSDNPMYEPSFNFYDERLWEDVKTGDIHVHMFFRLLALCHTVMAVEKKVDDKWQVQYQAQSPDEGALVSAARNFGFVFKGRTPNSVMIDVMGKTEVHELLCILDFNNERKRMSVILRKDDRITLYCKGADSVIYARLDAHSIAELQPTMTQQLNEFARSGLRTLCCAVKDVDPIFFADWKRRHHTASISLHDRDEKLSILYEEIEQDLVLLGATAIEDKLQDRVPECIANLTLAGIKIWVLTGDKQETAVNIGYSCKLLSEDMEELIIDGDTYDSVQAQLVQAKDDILSALAKPRPIVNGHAAMVGMNGNGQEKIPFMNGGGVGEAVEADEKSKMFGRTESIACQLEDFGGFALIINGQSLVHALTGSLEMLFLEVSSLCKAVICCRVTPMQKALVVGLVKRHKTSLTLAIGDGANDVSMIKTAHIGIGISGQEGMQAVLASDYALAQFAYLERLLLLHGRWSYFRMCKFLKYFFYKNFAFTLCHFWYAFFCGFSAQDVGEVNSIKYPKLYSPGHLDLLFNKKVFAQSVAEGIITSLVLFFVPYFSFYNAIKPDGLDIAGHKAFGNMVASALIVTVTLRCALDTSYWTGFNHFVIWGSIIFYFGFTFVFYSQLFDYTYLGTAVNLMDTSTFWYTLLLTVSILLLPVIAQRFYYADTQPTLVDRVRTRQRICRPRSKSAEPILRTHRRTPSNQSYNKHPLRSGYAFAHQEGFGELITTGSMMQAKRRRISTASSLKLCLPIGSRKSSNSLHREASSTPSEVARHSGGFARQSSTASKLSHSPPPSVSEAAISMSFLAAAAAGSQQNISSAITRKRMSGRGSAVIMGGGVDESSSMICRTPTTPGTAPIFSSPFLFGTPPRRTTPIPILRRHGETRADVSPRGYSESENFLASDSCPQVSGLPQVSPLAKTAPFISGSPEISPAGKLSANFHSARAIVFDAPLRSASTENRHSCAMSPLVAEGFPVLVDSSKFDGDLSVNIRLVTDRSGNIRSSDPIVEETVAPLEKPLT